MLAKSQVVRIAGLVIVSKNVKGIVIDVEFSVFIADW